ncbi:GNAT family N-acetyltransferase [Halobacillus sp. A1]|uniref:GNAT family N-acetyltransferase n=1 Tax=Halobacillus sp. A1 TaxID=2880262 RepID=UPI0020A65BA9|nr:GNAT family N-acetyltransferase [Halobacillus sp. A1]MCP3032336.1 GNAT family N-acetyltransferase [Halobacillus sp. A1]
MDIRFVNSSDYYVISPLINDWWGGREMSAMLPKLFFDHFNNSSFIAEDNGEIVGFLIGFMSQSKVDQAYIHFVGVHPDYREKHIGKHLYEEFYNAAQKEDRYIIKAITSPVNKTSVAYHTKMGFDIKDGDKVTDGISVSSDYDGPGQDRVIFVKHLN